MWYYVAIFFISILMFIILETSWTRAKHYIHTRCLKAQLADNGVTTGGSDVDVSSEDDNQQLHFDDNNVYDSDAE
jgi:hypothetical protein